MTYGVPAKWQTPSATGAQGHPLPRLPQKFQIDYAADLQILQPPVRVREVMPMVPLNYMVEGPTFIHVVKFVPPANYMYVVYSENFAIYDNLL